MTVFTNKLHRRYLTVSKSPLLLTIYSRCFWGWIQKRHLGLCLGSYLTSIVDIFCQKSLTVFAKKLDNRKENLETLHKRDNFSICVDLSDLNEWSFNLKFTSNNWGILGQSFKFDALTLWCFICCSDKEHLKSSSITLSIRWWEPLEKKIFL